MTYSLFLWQCLIYSKYYCEMLCLVSQSCPTLCNPMDCVACQAPLSMEFSRQEHWTGFPCLPSGNFPNQGIKSRSPTLQVGSLPSEPPEKPKNTGVGSLSFIEGTKFYCPFTFLDICQRTILMLHVGNQIGSITHD